MSRGVLTTEQLLGEVARKNFTIQYLGTRDWVAKSGVRSPQPKIYNTNADFFQLQVQTPSVRGTDAQKTAQATTATTDAEVSVSHICSRQQLHVEVN